MKKIIIYTCLLFVILNTQCEKDTPDPNNIPGLPPATQIGANTFGCLVNGKPWVPSGSNGTANLSIDYDPGFNNGIFGIVAYRFIAPTDEQLLVAVRDSLNFLVPPFTIQLSNSSLYSISFKRNCHWFNQFPDVKSSGTLTINKLDRIGGIISGEFNATMTRTGCDTIRITNGRFDFKF